MKATFILIGFLGISGVAHGRRFTLEKEARLQHELPKRSGCRHTVLAAPPTPDLSPPLASFAGAGEPRRNGLRPVCHHTFFTIPVPL